MVKRGQDSVLLLVLGFLLACTVPNSLDDQVSKECNTWKYLFDGESLSGWESTPFGGEGTVRVKGGAIVLGAGDSLTGITWKGSFPTTDYEVTLDAQRVKGNDFFCCLTIPVRDSFCSLIIGGWGGSVIGISSIDGVDASENETTRLMKFEKGRWYNVRVRVESTRIIAWIDEKQVVDLAIQGRHLNVRPEVRLSRPFGIASWQTTAALRNIRLEFPLTSNP